MVLQTELVDQSDIQGTFQLSRFLIRVLFKCGFIMHLIHAYSCIMCEKFRLRGGDLGRGVTCEFSPRD